jgi:hypothetical protein
MVDLITLAEVMPRISALSLSAKVQEAEIHLILCSTLDHIRVHGDSTGMTAMFNGMPLGLRVKAMGAWARHFSNGKIAMKVEKGVWSCTLGKKRLDADFDMVGALATTFADLTEERDPTTLTVEKFTKGLIRTANNTANFEGTSQPKVDPAVRALCAKLNAYIRTLEDKAADAAVQAMIDAQEAAKEAAKAERDALRVTPPVTSNTNDELDDVLAQLAA